MVGRLQAGVALGCRASGPHLPDALLLVLPGALPVPGHLGGLGVLGRGQDPRHGAVECGRLTREQTTTHCLGEQGVTQLQAGWDDVDESAERADRAGRRRAGSSSTPTARAMSAASSGRSATPSTDATAQSGPDR